MNLLEDSKLAYTLGAKKRLKSRTDIRQLFAKAKGFSVYPLRFLAVPREDDLIKCGFSAPKSRFKKAVDRNELKRKIRESYRLAQHVLKDQDPMSVMIIYVGKEQHDYATIAKAMDRGLAKLVSKETGN